MAASAEALRALKEIFGHDGFRPGQEPLVTGLTEGRDVLGIMPTGAGKSICYQVPALLREGVTLVISPLISLMQDQVAALKAAGVPAAYLNSSLTPNQLDLACSRAAQGAYRVIYVAPERLNTPSFLGLARTLRVALVAVDEAHCISQWGQDFRPEYLRIADFLRSLPARPPVGAFTATATERVQRDIIDRLGLIDPVLSRTGFDRPNLYFEVLPAKKKNDALLAFMKGRREQSGIVYCASRKKTEEVCELLKRNGYAAGCYHAGMADADRRRMQEDFSYDRVRVMAATNAFGMGIDKSNVNFVVHYNMPKSMEAYYQEAGRAGRDGTDAECLLLYSVQDVIIQKHLIMESEPNPGLTA